MSARISSRGAQGLRLVEVASKADFVANFDAAGHIPGVRYVRQHLALRRKASMPPSCSSGTCSVSRSSWVRLVFDYGGLTVDRVTAI